MINENISQITDKKENELNRERFTILWKILDSINQDIQSKEDGDKKKFVINMIKNKPLLYNLKFKDGDEEKDLGTGKFSKTFKVLKEIKEKDSKNFVYITDLIGPLEKKERPALNKLIYQVKEILPDFRVSANYQIGENGIGYALYWFPNKSEKKYTEEEMCRICKKIINLFN